MIPATSLTGLILAGGLSRRMQNREKAFLPLAGRPLLSHVLERLLPQVGEVVINANGDPSRFSSFGCPVIPDRRSGFLGPLAGIEAAFLAHPTDWLLSVPIDTPFFPEDLASLLGRTTQGEAIPVVAASQGRLHPVVALWPRAILPAVSRALDSGKFRLHGLLQEQKYKSHPFPVDGEENDPFFNINCSEDYAWAKTCREK